MLTHGTLHMPPVPYLLETALTYARRGWPIFPCHPPTRVGCSCHQDCGNNRGKHPRTRNGLKDATTARAQIERWWTMWPDANMAVVTGAASGLVVLDIDARKGGELSLEALCARYGPLPPTPEQQTGNGRHIVFAHPGVPIKNSVEDIGSGLDIRGAGGYILVAPSLHQNGKHYIWEVSHDPADVPLAPMPKWLLATCVAPRARQGAIDLVAPIPEGQRNDKLFRIGCGLRTWGFTEAVVKAALLELNATQCQPPLPAEEVEHIATSCTRYEPGCAQDGEDVPVLKAAGVPEPPDDDDFSHLISTAPGRNSTRKAADTVDAWLGPRHAWRGVPAEIRRGTDEVYGR